MRTYKKPDLNAPRFAKKLLRIISPEFIERFRKKYPQYSKIKDTELAAKMKTIMNSLGDKMWMHTANNRDGVELPEALGYVFLGSYKGKIGDRPTSAELGVLVSHKNWHSDNLCMKIFYSNFSNRYRFLNREAWMFLPARKFSRNASAIYKKDPFKYLRHSDIRNLSKLFRKDKFIDKMNMKEAFTLDNYDEFDMT